MEEEKNTPTNYDLLKEWNQRGEKLKLYGVGEKRRDSMGLRDVYKISESYYRLQFKPSRMLGLDKNVQLIEKDMTEAEALAWLEHSLWGGQEFRRGCWLAAGATAVFLVAALLTLAVLVLVMGLSLATIFESVSGVEGNY